MEPKDYIVLKIDGDYAILKRTDKECGDDLFIARALLPLDIYEGTKIHYECMEYTIME